MTQPYMTSEDFVNGKFGQAFATIQNRRYFLFNLKKFEGPVETEIKQVQVLGSLMTKNIVVGASGKFSGEMYDCTDIFNQMLLQAIETGNIKLLRFDLQIVQDDKNFQGGRRSTIYKDCLMSKHILAQLDVENTELSQSIEGTFDEVKGAESFAVLNAMNAA